MTESPRYLCICADDFGMSAGINSAVFDLAEQRKISATSGMVRREAWLAGAKVLRSLDPAEFDTGLHLDLTRPAHAGGPEPGLGGLLARTWSRTIFAPGLQADIRDQLTRFEDAMGRAPAFVDGHRHVHQFPVVRELLVEEIARRYPTSPPWVRNTAPGWRHGPDRLKARVIHALGGARLAALAKRRGIPMSSRLLGVYDFSGDIQRHEQRLSEWLAASRTGDVLMCHPSAGIMAGDPHGGARLREYTALRGLSLGASGGNGENSGITLAPLSQCLQRG
ncbi:ChbG/HpnK family deacetylase [Variovorax sp. W6]|uniref:ChbG/HpnK family deacetylase n=1 Tax=Variovorax sp. W6 TaxID=3093895 RepID=UPI003D808411